MFNYIFNAADPKIIDRDKLKLRYAFCGAAPLPVELIRGFKEKFNIDIVEGYGLTEVIGVSTVNPPVGIKKTGSVGTELSPSRKSRLWMITIRSCLRERKAKSVFGPKPTCRLT